MITFDEFLRKYASHFMLTGVGDSVFNINLYSVQKKIRTCTVLRWCFALFCSVSIETFFSYDLQHTWYFLICIS